MTGEWKAKLTALIDCAEAERKWLFLRYQALWVAPDELRVLNAQGRYGWGAENWELRDPQERVDELKFELEMAKQLFESVSYRVAKFKEGKADR